MVNFNIPDLKSTGACKGEDPELFFPIRAKDTMVINAAKAICARCVVQAECLEWALGNQEKHGIWGGLTEQERQTLTRRQARQRKLVS